MRFLVFASLFLVSCTHNSQNRNPASESCEYKARFVSEVRERYPRPPRAYHYQKGDMELTFVAARHVRNPETPTYQLITRVFEEKEFSMVFIESGALAHGQSKEDYIKRAKRDLRMGEPAHTALLAHERSIPFETAELHSRDLQKGLREAGFGNKDLLTFYFMEEVNRYLSYRRNIKDLRGFFQKEIPKIQERYGMRHVKFSYSDFRSHYLQANGREYSTRFRRIDRQPIKNSELMTQRLNAWLVYIRDENILKVVREKLEENEKVLIVYGAGHFPTEAKAYQCLLGEPETL